MLIKEEEKLKKWLNFILEPLSEADPDALSKYVFALIKKDKAKEDIKSLLLEQLEIFLQKETKYFVELLFSTLENKHYIMLMNDEKFPNILLKKYEKNDNEDKNNNNIENWNEEEASPSQSSTPKSRPSKVGGGKFNSKKRSNDRRPFYKKSRRSENYHRSSHSPNHHDHYHHHNHHHQRQYLDYPEYIEQWQRKPRCNDFDMKGYCMRGEICPYDHGNNPVILKDSKNMTTTTTVTPSTNGYPFWNSEISHTNQQETPSTLSIIDKETEVLEYNPTNPSINTVWPENSTNKLDKPKKSNWKIAQNTAIGLKKIPSHLNTIDNLTKHFSKFGKIMNIHILFEGDPQAALIIFSNHNEAKAAYTSTEPVFNNRFIKIFWHNHPIPQISNTITPKKTSNSNIYIPTIKTSPESSNQQENETSTIPIPTSPTNKIQNELKELYNNRKEIIQRYDKKKITIIQLNDLIKKHNILHDKLLNEQRQIISKWNNIKVKEELTLTLNSLQKKITSNREVIEDMYKKSLEFKNTQYIIEELNKEILKIEEEKRQALNDGKDTIKLDNDLILKLKYFSNIKII